MPPPQEPRIAVIGLGYVGLPLALALAEHYPCLGFDKSAERIEQLREGRDRNTDVPSESLAVLRECLSHEPNDLRACNTYIVAVPTPIDDTNRPLLTPLIEACETLGPTLRAGDVVVFESTVYPGATEEVCVPALEQASGLRLNTDFYVGYSPERINPGDTEHTLANTPKVTSASTPEARDYVDRLYRRIVTAGTCPVSRIRVAEAVKVIENTQRDTNIALINEFAVIFKRLGIDTEEVLNAAGTKWNFLPFRPGLVGGHCIGVDPYYLVHKAQTVGYFPEIIAASRRVNEQMSHEVVNDLVLLMARHRIPVLDARVLFYGMTFKENCSDLRNTKVLDIIDRLQAQGAAVDVHDPHLTLEQLAHRPDIRLVDAPEAGVYDAAVIAVAHREWRDRPAGTFRAVLKEGGVLYDIKYLLPADQTDGRL